MMESKGEITNKDGRLLKYEKVGNDIVFLLPNQNIPMKMTFNQFLNYLYSELYVDNRIHSSNGQST